MQVWSSQGGELTFDHAQLRVPVLGHILEENLLRTALFEKVQEKPQIDFFCPRTFHSLQEKENYFELSGPSSQSSLCAKLIVGADGAQSWVREQAGIALRVHDYQHSALIAQVETESPHLKTARQVFLCDKKFPTGPLAFLPLSEAHHCSIVWSTAPNEAERLLHLEESAFQELLSEAFDFRLGKILAVSKRQIFPLFERHAESYVKNRLALIGDAAHTLHPLAGQGVNLGIADARTLAEVIGLALQKNRDFASFSTLRRYERICRGDNQLMQAAVKLLKTLFTNENRGLSFMGSKSLGLTNHCHPLKNFFAYYAMGTLTPPLCNLTTTPVKSMLA